MIDVFKTNVQEVKQAKELQGILLAHFPGSDIHFDLEDCDRILRVKHPQLITGKITSLMEQLGYLCEALPD